MIKRVYTMSKDELEHHQAQYQVNAVATGKTFTDLAHTLLVKMLKDEGIKYEEGDPPAFWEMRGYKFIDVQVAGKPESPANGIYLMKYDGQWKPIACITTAFIDSLGNANITYYDFRTDDAVDVGGVKLK